MYPSWSRRQALGVITGAALAGPAAQSLGQPYPSKPVRIVVGAGAGGPVDVAVRVVANKLTEAWGVPVIIDNRGGAGGMIGADSVAKSAPDGATIFAGSLAPSVIAGSRKRTPYDAYKDFTHVSILSTFAMSIVVPAESKFQNLKQLVDEIRARPGALNYASGGVGSSSHLFFEMMGVMADLRAVNVPFQGGGPALNALIGGQVDFGVLGVTIVHAQIGRLRALAVTSADPQPKLADAPVVASLVPGYAAEDFVSLHMPKSAPKEIVDRMQRDVAAILQQPDVKASFDDLAMRIRATSPEEADAFIRSEIEKWRPVIKATGLDAT